MSKVQNEHNETVKAGCVVVDDRGRVLLAMDTRKGFWEFPKGHAEVGETPEQVALREVKEETGYNVEIIGRLPDLTYVNPHKNEPVRVAMFQARPIAKVAEPEEKDIRAEWYTADEARKMLFPNVVFLLDALDARQGRD